MPYTLLITATVLAVIFSFGLGVFSLWRNAKATVVRLWFLMSMAITVWGIGYLLTLLTSDAAFALLSLRMVYVGAILVPMFFFHFVAHLDRKSTRLNSSHSSISYAVFCLKISELSYENFVNTILTGEGLWGTIHTPPA